MNLAVMSTLYHNESLYIFRDVASPHRLYTSSEFWNIWPELLGSLCPSIAHNLGKISWLSLPKDQKTLSTWNSRFCQIDPCLRLGLADRDSDFLSIWRTFDIIVPSALNSMTEKLCSVSILPPATPLPNHFCPASMDCTYQMHEIPWRCSLRH